MGHALKLSCSCGATFEGTMSTFIKDGGAPDEKGRRFLIEVRADEWSERHNGCLSRSPFLSAVIQDGPNKGKTVGECISAGFVKPD